jgi:hypothetical protein
MRRSDPSIGIDGDMNGVAIPDRGVELEWWCEGPPAWQRFTSGVETIRCELERTIVA